MSPLARTTIHYGVAVALVGAIATASLATQRLAARGGGEATPHAKLAKGKFLVASRSVVNPTFFEAVILLVDYDARGALGVVVNRPTAIPLVEALPEVKELRRRKDVVFLGGPVARDRMLVLMRTAKEPPDSLLVFDRVYASGSLDALRNSLNHGEGVRAFAGYAGWGPGQLDAEVARGDWLIGPADSKALFDAAPNGIWDDLVERFTGNWTALPGPRFAAE
jgi:putative transcriptional regulator